MWCLSAEANTFNNADGDVFYNISKRMSASHSDILQTQKGMAAILVSDWSLHTCFDNIDYFYDKNSDLTEELGTLISLSSWMKDRHDEILVNQFIDVSVAALLKTMKPYREGNNNTAGSCSNNPFIVSHSNQINSLIDELVAALQSAQRKLASKKSR
jgi:hypothetical protein